jgi:integrase
MKRMNEKKSYYDEYIENIKNWAIPTSEKKQVLKFFKDYEIGKITNNISTKRTMEHYIIYLKVALEFINKPLEKITEKDIDEFSTALLKDEVLSGHKTPFALSVKAKIRRTLLQYLEWRIPKKASSINSSLKVKTKQTNQADYKYLTEKEIDVLYKNCKDDAERYLVAVLFSSGARASEFYNIRFSDIKMPEGKDNFVCLTLREEFSKTKGRTIRLYYKHALEAVGEFLEIRKKEGIKPEDPIWNLKFSTTQKRVESFGSVRRTKRVKGKKQVVEFGRKILNKHLNMHMFRSSCATWMANKLNHQQMCYYFGWKFSSPMPDIYISRKGMVLDDADKKFEQTEMSELQSKLSRQEHENKLKNEEMETQRKELEKLKEDFESFKNGEVIFDTEQKKLLVVGEVD